MWRSKCECECEGECHCEGVRVIKGKCEGDRSECEGNRDACCVKTYIPATHNLFEQHKP